MTLAAPRSRQGKAFLVLAIFAAMAVSAAGLLFWSSYAHADIPATTVSVDDNAGASIPAGSLITYTISVDVTGAASGTTTNTILSVNFDDDLTNFVSAGVNVGPWATGECLNGAGNVLTCTDAAGPIVDATVIVTYQANGAAISPPTACTVDDGGTGGATCTIVPVADVTVTAGVTVEPSTNFPGIAHTFDFSFLAGWTCESDNNNDSGDAECDSTDVTVGGTVPCTASTPVVDPDSTPGTGPVGPTTVHITVTPSTGAEGTCTVTLAVFFTGTGVGDDDGSGNDCCDTTVIATKTYDASVAGGTLCHLDLPDAGSEDASGNTDGILYESNNDANDCIQDDADDAIGSFHAACIEGSDLTYADNGGDITWSITPVAGGPTPASVQGFAGPNDEPCVMWGAGSTGTQQITATYAPGAPSPSVNYYWNEYCVTGGECFDSSNDSTTDGPLPLIKEWNTIDSTKLIGADGNVGDTLDDNTGGLILPGSRDCVADEGICGNASLDGTTWDVGGVLFPTPSGVDCPPFSGGCISANGPSFIDYTMGHHGDAGGAYNGPVDGALQTYSVDGDCGTVRLEDPTTGNVIRLAPDNSLDGDSAQVLSSDKGVAFQVVPNAEGNIATSPSTANCEANGCLTVTIDTQEDHLFHSPPLFEAEQEVITVCFHVGPPTNKQPLLAWAGQRVVLEHDWSFTDVNGDRSCPFAPQGTGDFFVRYLKESGNGGFVSDLGHGAATGPDFMVVRVNGDPNGDSNADPEDNCVSRVLYESQDQGEQDVVAHVVTCEEINNLSASVQGGTSTPTPVPTLSPGSIDPDTCSVISEQVAFLVYYMKFEDITLKLIPDETTHGSTPSQSSSAVSVPDGADSTTANVSANVLARATVRGWVLADNCPARESAVGSNGEFIPANRCIFPDDWLFKAGGATALETRPNYDIYGGSTTLCSSSVAGPFSQLDAPGCGGTLAPHAPFDDGQRETNFPNGDINADDAPMPSALIRFLLSGSGFLLGADKSNPTAQFDVTHIPAEPWITPINSDGSGYQWNSWGTGGKSGVYHYWTDLADHGPEVLSCAGSSSDVTATSGACDAASDVGVPTGGYQLTRVYSDEHGVAMTWINGDANLDFRDCADSAATAGHQIVLLNGFYCEKDDVVGSSTLNALADYPDKRKHFAILSDDVTVTWTWGGIKQVTVEPDPFDSTGEFNYVVLHVTDRDGFCQEFDSPFDLHPVLGERVDFRIDSTTGVIVPDQNGNDAEGPASSVDDHGKSATTHTFNTGVNASIQNGGITVEPVIQDDPAECQAWIHVSESLLNQVNVIVTAFDPEGTVTFDTKDINPTPTPTEVPTSVPTPSPTPANQANRWADFNCDGSVNPVDALIALLVDASKPFTPPAHCPAPNAALHIIQGSDEFDKKWGDADCDGDISPVDALKMLKYDAAQFYIQTEPCPDIGSEVLVPAQ